MTFFLSWSFWHVQPPADFPSWLNKECNGSQFQKRPSLPPPASVFHPSFSVHQLRLPWASFSPCWKHSLIYIYTHSSVAVVHSLFPSNTMLCFYEIPEVLFFSFFFFLLPLHWLPCGEDRGAILCRVTSAGCPPLFKIFIHKLPGAFYSTSNSSPTGEALSWRIQIGERGEKKGRCHKRGTFKWN